MKPPIVIPATAEASSEYRLAQSLANIEREGLKQVGRTIFKKGKPLDVEKCFMTTPIDGWTPPSPHTTLQKVVHGRIRANVDKQFSDKGLAATIAITDTIAGVRETIEYDENELIVLEQLEGDRSVRG